MKLAFVDVETTGLDPIKNGVIRAYMKLFDGESETVTQVDCQSHINDEIESKALEVNGVTIPELSRWMPSEIGYNTFRNALESSIDPYNKLDKAFFLAYNAHFDYNFLYAWFKKHNDKYLGSFFWSPPIDVMSLAAHYLMVERPKMKNFKLGTVAEKLGSEVKKEELHNPMYDVDLTISIYNKVKGGKSA